jgi:hypothetical protein
MSRFVESKRTITSRLVYFATIVFDSGSKLCYKSASASLTLDRIAYHTSLIVLGVRSVPGTKETLHSLKMPGLGFVAGSPMFRELPWG